MSTQSFYTPAKAAEFIGCAEKDVIDHIKAGRLRASFLDNIANYVITHSDLLDFLKVTRDFKTVVKMLSRRVLVVDRDPKVQDILRMELTRQGCEVRVATSDREINFLAGDYQPDVVCVHLGATTRAESPVKASLERARTVQKSYIILYHNYTAGVASAPEVLEQIKAIAPDALVVTDRGMSPLIDAIRTRLGLKPTGAMRRPAPPAGNA